jgi:CspA family cold shock protein
MRTEVIPMENGTIKWFDKERNYGFIERGNGDSDVFVHGDDVESDTFLNTGDHVTFELKEGNGRPKALKVSKK